MTLGEISPYCAEPRSVRTPREGSNNKRRGRPMPVGSGHCVRVRVRWVPLVACVLAAGLGACTIFAPMQQPRSDRLVLDMPSGKALQPCVPRPEAPDDCRVPYFKDDESAGGLALALWQLDERRRELNGYVIDQGNLTSTYNALLWPVGAHLINKKYRDRSWSVRDAVAIAIASYGLLNSGVSERDRLYLDASQQMLCVWVTAQADLYPDEDVRTGPPTGDLKALNTAIVGLENAVAHFDSGRRGVLLKIQRKPEEAPAGNWVDKRRREAVGRGAAAQPPGDDPAQSFSDATQAMLSAGRSELQRLRDAQTRILGAAGAVRLKRTRIESALVRAISQRVELKNPFDVAREIGSVIEQKLAAEKRQQDSLASAESGRRAPPEAWFPTPDRIRALKDPEPVRAFWGHEVDILEGKRQDARQWLADDAQRAKEASTLAREIGCEGGSLAAFAEMLLKSPARPASGASPDSGQKTTVEPLR
ncbi:MAG: hypothetical protein KF788_16825 [Piscinibacter sp.]|nr:hypothetical protein [Piscinibacter sp.]